MSYEPKDNPLNGVQVEGRPKLQRCGACGAFQSDPSGYTEEEQSNAELVHCGCEQEERMRITRDMAIDAGDPSMEGEYY